MTVQQQDAMCGDGRRGQALVEMALVLPLLLLLLVGIFDFGRAVYANHTIGNASRQAVRVAIVNQTVGAAEASAQDHAVGLVIDVTVEYFHPTPEVDPTENDVCDPPIRECIAVVTVTTSYQPATPIIGNIVGPFEMQAVTEMPIERRFPTS